MVSICSRSICAWRIMAPRSNSLMVEASYAHPDGGKTLFLPLTVAGRRHTWADAPDLGGELRLEGQDLWAGVGLAFDLSL